MRRAGLLAVLALTATTLVPAQGTEEVTSGTAYGRIENGAVVLGNEAVERRWDAGALATTLLADKRTGLTLGQRHPDFRLTLDGASVASDALPLTGVSLEAVPEGGVRAIFDLASPGVAGLRRTVEVYPGIAGFHSQTTVHALAPLALSSYTLDEVAAGAEPAPTIHAFRAGADWRDPAWGPQVAVGDPHTGDWRDTRTAPPGAALAAPGEWLSLAYPGGATAFVVMERRDYASSRMSYDGATGAAVVDLSRDVVYFGPFEEDVHAENPAAGPARHRVALPGRPLSLEPAFTGLGAGADDEPWQHFEYLMRGPAGDYARAVTFNTNNVDRNQISTGAKDDVDYARFLSLLAAAREMGVETFIFDDGWQAASGDWCADSPACPEPRHPRFPHRFPDPEFAAVGEQLRGDPQTAADDVTLGLWMTPMEFHPRSTPYQRSPEWACAPVGHATAAVSLADPNGGSNEAGIGVWNPDAIGTHPDTGEPMRLADYIESRIRRAIDVYGARYFKFDFLVWIDCLGVEPADMYRYHDAFVEMVDRLLADYPSVTFQIDETNDYRMFPFESVARGPSWFQNGSPASHRLLHNLWNLAPYVPGFSLGQHALGSSADRTARGIDYLMAVALGSHITFWTEIDVALTAAQRTQVGRWTDFYKQNREALATFTYPLLDDPIGKGWTALQPWDPDAGRGFLLAYRQEAPNATQSIPLRGIPGGRAFSLTAVDPATGAAEPLGDRTSEELSAGIDVTIPAAYGYRIIRIGPAA